MKETKIIIDSLLVYHQKRNLIILFFSTLVITFGVLYNAKGFIFLKFSLIIFLILIFHLFLIKKGFLFSDNQLFKVLFIYGIFVRKRTINTTGFPFFTIHKYKNKLYDYPSATTLQKRWEPNLNYNQFTYYLYLTNENQYKKKEILIFEKAEKQKTIIDFLEQNTTLTYRNA